MSILNSILVRYKPKSIPFTIYENAYLTSAQDEAAQQQYAAITMTGYYEFGYKNTVDIAFEPLENGDFSSDSIQSTPFDLFVIGVVSQVVKTSSYNAADVLRDQAVVEAALDKYLHGTTLLLITPNAPLVRTYSSLHLLTVAYDYTPNKTHLVAYMTFRQIRQTTPEAGGLITDQIDNPENSSPVDNGNVIALPPSIDTANLTTMMGALIMLLEIPISAIPNQSITTLVNNQQITLNFYQRGGNLFGDIYLGSNLIAGGVKCNNAIYLNQYTSAFDGYLFFYTLSNEDPTYLTLGTDAFLFFSDYDALAIAYANWLSQQGG